MQSKEVQVRGKDLVWVWDHNVIKEDSEKHRLPSESERHSTNLILLILDLQLLEVGPCQFRRCGALRLDTSK